MHGIVISTRVPLGGYMETVRGLEVEKNVFRCTRCIARTPECPVVEIGRQWGLA